jgi:Icc-related predicted phosphoesterase
MKIVCLSDTHAAHNRIQVPDGDILLHAGDVSRRGLEHEIIEFNEWLGTLPHKHKIMIAGNHDFMFEKYPKPARKLITNAIYLEDEGIEIEGLSIWGSPITPWFYNWAFNRHRGAAIRKFWDMIPAKTDILITHGPPLGILDQTDRGEAAGCEDLLEAVHRIKPKLHLFGHIHEGYGMKEIDGTTFINASIMDIEYRPVNKAVVFEI